VGLAQHFDNPMPGFLSPVRPSTSLDHSAVAVTDLLTPVIAERLTATKHISKYLGCFRCVYFKPEPDAAEIMGAVDDPSVRWNNTLDHLKQHPHDSEGWRNAIAISQENGILKEVAETYQTLLHYFPNTVRRP
jgi:hypothetical protein